MTGSGPVARLMFGAALRTQRTQAGMSLRELGRAVHYDHSRLSRAENGEHLPALRLRCSDLYWFFQNPRTGVWTNTGYNY